MSVAPDPAVEVPPVRATRRPRDLILSLLVILVPVALLVGVYRGLHGGDEPVLVDPAPVIEQARRADHFPVAEPVGLAAGWRSLSARYDGDDGDAELRIGYLTPSGDGALLVESDRAPVALLANELTVAARPEGARNVDGKDWQRYSGRPGERALVLLEPGRTLLVVGAATEDDLAALAAALS